MGRTYLPRGVAEKIRFFARFAEALSAIGPEFGFSAEEVESIDAAAAAARSATAARDAALAALRAAQAEADQSLEAATQTVRAAVFRLQVAPGMTDDLRKLLGLTVPDRVRTIAPPPDAAPHAVATPAGRLAHRVTWFDPQRPTVRRRPRGVDAVEVWARIAPAGETSPAEPRFLLSLKKSATVIDYPAADAGKRAEYLLRFVNTRGVRGPFGAPASLGIAA